MITPNSNGTGWQAVKQAAEQSKIGADATRQWTKYGNALKATLNEILGPMALLSGAALGFLTKLGGILATSRLIGRSIDEWARVQVLTPQFTRLLGTMNAAQRRLKEIAAFSRKGPFKFEDAAEGNRRLQILTRGALATKSGMALTADVAAATGESMANAAAAIGSVYDAASRDPQALAGQIDQLVQMGAVSAAAADDIRNLANQGGNFAQVWGAVQTELARAKGAAGALQNTILGLSMQVENVKTDNLASIGEMFNEGRMAGLRAALAFWQTFGPVIRELLSPVAALYNGFMKAAEGVTSFFTANKGLVQILTATAKAFGLLIAALAFRGIGDTLGFFLKLVLGLGSAATKAQVAGAAVLGLANVFRILGSTIYRALGPLGLLVAGLEAAFALMGNGPTADGGMIGGMIEHSREQNDALKKTIEDIRAGRAGAGVAADTVGASLDNETESRKAREAAEARLRATQGGAIPAILSGAATGAWLGSAFGPVGTAVGAVGGAVVGGLMNASSQSEAQRQYNEAMANENDASGIATAARKQFAQTPTDYLNNPAFAAQKQKAQAEMDALEGKADQLKKRRATYLENGMSVDVIDEALKEIAGKMKTVAAEFSPEAIQKEFDRQMMSGDLKSRTLDQVAQLTGDPNMQAKADAEKDKMTRMSAVKRYEEAGYGKDEAENMAGQEVALSQLQRARDRNPVIASALGAAGGAGKEVYGGVPEQQLAALLKLVGIGESMAPHVARQPDYSGHLPGGNQVGSTASMLGPSASLGPMPSL